MEKIKGVMIFVLAISLFSFVNADCADSQIILKLSSESNAHGAIWSDANYQTKICYDTIFGNEYSGANPHADSGTNKTLGLSSSTNAHAQIPSLTNYLTTVNYGNLICRKASSCDADEECVVTLSSDSNAHLAECNSAGNYSLKICCKESAGNCVLNEANTYWTDSNGNKIEYEVIEGTEVKMISEGSAGCEEQSLTFNIYEEDCAFGICSLEDQGISVDATFSDGKVVASWITQWTEDNGGTDANPEYVFKIVDSISEVKSNELKVVKESDAYWTNDEGKRISYKDIFPMETKLGMVLKNTGLVSGTAVDFEIYKDNSLAIDTNIRTGNDAVTGYVNESGVASANWTMTYEEWDKINNEREANFYFRANGKRSSFFRATIIPPGYCLSISSCQHYDTESKCINDPCGIAIDWMDKFINLDCGESNINCKCIWDGINCSAFDNVGEKCGNGIVDSGEQCDDGNLNNNDGCNSTCNYVSGSKPCDWGTLCADGTCSFNCDVTDNGFASCNNNGICDSGEGCSCIDCDKQQDSCATGRYCSFQDKSCCKNVSDGKCELYCINIDPDCYFIPEDTSTIGNCTFHESTNDNCDDGSLTYSWASVVKWPSDNNGLTTNPNDVDFIFFNKTIETTFDNKWHYDPVGTDYKRPLFNGCRKGERTVPCPSKTQLPFFNTYNLIGAFILIALIYLSIIRKEKK